MTRRSSDEESNDSSCSVLQATTRTKTMLMRVLSFADELVRISKGATERCENLINLGRIQFYLQQYNDAHKSFESALEFAKEIHGQFGEPHLLQQVTSMLMVSHRVRKEYSNVEYMLRLVEDVFAADPEKMGYVFYTRMKWHEHQENNLLAKKCAYTALDWFKQTGDAEQIGKSMINVAHFEYRTKNYKESAHILNSAIELLRPYDFSLLFCIKEYAKTLLRLREYDSARSLIEDYDHLAFDYPDLRGKLQILYTHANNDSKHAILIADDPTISHSVRALACRHLMQYFSLKDDAESVMKYYKKGRMLSTKSSDFFDEEEI